MLISGVFLIYLDNATTSFPKPEALLQGIKDYLENVQASPYRGSSSNTKKANSHVLRLRSLLAKDIGVDKSNHICFTYNATYAINLLLKGFLKENDHVICSSFDHNSLLRPLNDLKKRNVIDYDIWECDREGVFDLSNLEKLVRPNTRLMFFSAHSNVVGMPMPLKSVSELAKQRNIPLGLDLSQSLGHKRHPLNCDEIALAVGTGHKGLLGPPGIGFFYIKDPHLVHDMIQGGGGYVSSELDQPDIAPAKFEGGTLNYLGIMGLLNCIEWAKSQDFQENLKGLFAYLKSGLGELKSVKIYGDLESSDQLPLLSFNVEGFLPNQVEGYLETKGIIVRGGLHCSPLMHKALGTYPHGTVRVSLSPFNTKDQIDKLLASLKLLAGHNTSA